MKIEVIKKTRYYLEVDSKFRDLNFNRRNDHDDDYLDLLEEELINKVEKAINLDENDEDSWISHIYDDEEIADLYEV